MRLIHLAAAALLSLTTAPAVAVEAVTLQLPAGPSFRFAGYYAALWEGYYAEAGLSSVKIRRGPQSESASPAVALEAVRTGSADFAVDSGANILFGNEHGPPVTVLASIFQASGTTLYARQAAWAGPEVRDDLLPLRLARRPGEPLDVEVAGLLGRTEFGTRRISIVPLSEHSLADLAAGRIDLMPGDRTELPRRARELRLTVREVGPPDEPDGFYGDSLFASSDLVERHPHLAAAFREASLRGWQYALDHADAVAQRIATELPGGRTNEDPIAAGIVQADVVRRLVRPQETSIGKADPVRWSRMAAALLGSGLLRQAPDLTRLVYNPARAVAARRGRRSQLLIAALLAATGTVAALAWRARRLGARLRATAAELNVSEGRLRDFGALASDWFWEQDAALSLCWASPRFHQFSDLATAYLFGRAEQSPLLPVTTGDPHRTPREDLARLHLMRDVVVRVSGPDGRTRWLGTSASPIFDSGGRVTGYRNAGRDLTKLIETEFALERSVRTLDQLLDASPLGVIEWGLEGPEGGRPLVRRWSGQAEAIFGWPSAEATGQPLETLVSVSAAELAISAENLEGDRRVVNLICRTRDGKIVRCRWHNSVLERVDGGQAILSLIEDHTAQAEAEERIRHLAHHDALTGLPNRLLLGDRLHQALSIAGRHGRKAALMLVDLDEFKEINDTLGHPAGDALIGEVAGRLSARLRASDTVARLGGDEFAVLLPEVAGPDEAQAIAEVLLAAIRAPARIAGAEVAITGSLGLAVFPEDGRDAEELLKHADIALYQAKADGRDRGRIFSRELRRANAARRDLELGLRHALERGEFTLHYQPRFDLRTGAATGAEALLRWRRSDGTFVAPGLFVPAAEASGLIIPIGEWVLDEACRQARVWHDAGIMLTVAVNLSAHQARRGELADFIRVLLARHSLDVGLLELEITESVFFDRQSEECLTEVAALGVGFAIDDFGTGYCSLGYLDRLPFQRLKVDRGFVAGIGRNTNAEAIVSSVVDLAHRLGRVAVAEGVETDAQRAFLIRMGCDEAQGFLLARPVPAEDLVILAQDPGMCRPGLSRAEPMLRLVGGRDGRTPETLVHRGS